jgi:hypothetical protein
MMKHRPISQQEEIGIQAGQETNVSPNQAPPPENLIGMDPGCRRGCPTVSPHEGV